MANAIAALRTMLKPMRFTAVRRSVTALPLKFRAAELASCSEPAASAGSEPTTRTTLSGVTVSSASTWRTRMAMSGKLGSSTLPVDSSAASAWTNANASGSLIGEESAFAGLCDISHLHRATSAPVDNRRRRAHHNGGTGAKIETATCRRVPLLAPACFVKSIPSASVVDVLRHLVDGHHIVHGADGDGLPRHAPHHAGCLVLRHRCGCPRPASPSGHGRHPYPFR